MTTVTASRMALASAVGPQVAWAVACAAVVLQVVSVAIRLANGSLGAGAVVGLTLVVLPIAGAIVVNQQPWNAVGWLLLVAGVAALVSTQVEHESLAAFAPSARSPWLALASEVAWPLGFPLLVAALLLVFPDGMAEGAWRWALGAGLLGTALLLFGVLTRSWGPADHGGMANPWAVESAPVLGVANPLGLLLVAAAGLAGIARLVCLYRSGQGEARAQIRVLLAVAGAAAVLVAALSALAPLIGSPSWLEESTPGVVVIGFPLAVAYAVTRRRLYTYSLVVDRRAVVTVASLGAAAAVFIAAALLLLPLGEFEAGAAAMLLAVTAGLAARRLFLRHRPDVRDEPRIVLSRLPVGDKLEPKLTEWAALVRDATGAPTVEIRLAERPPIRSGSTVSLPSESFALGATEHPYGELVVSQRSPSERWDEEHLQLLAGIAQLITGTIEEARATQEARESRRALAASIATERERLHRDVHDQLGPRLAGIGYLLAAVDPAPDGHVYLSRARAELVGAAEDARRIAHDLQPRPIEELGLGEAIRQYATRWAAASGIELDLHVDPSLELAEPQATAVYSVALEAITNVGRHARATRCVIRLHTDDGRVRLTVRDDGTGIAAPAGVGIDSMHRRATDLGGTLLVESDRGTAVHLEVPLDA